MRHQGGAVMTSAMEAICESSKMPILHRSGQVFGIHHKPQRRVDG